MTYSIRWSKSTDINDDDKDPDYECSTDDEPDEDSLQEKKMWEKTETQTRAIIQ